MAKYAEKEAPLLERIIMQEGLERTKAEDWARDEITRLREETARLREALKPLAQANQWSEDWHDGSDCEINVQLRDIRRAASLVSGYVWTPDE